MHLADADVLTGPARGGWNLARLSCGGLARLLDREAGPLVPDGFPHSTLAAAVRWLGNGGDPHRDPWLAGHLVEDVWPATPFGSLAEAAVVEAVRRIEAAPV